jgi:hypothetical protein
MIALESYIQSFKNMTDQFITTFVHLDDDQLNWRPDSTSWSIAQIIEHIIIINESYYPVFDAIKNGTYKAPALAKLSFIPNFLGNMIEKSLQPETTRKTKTFPVWEPHQSRIPGITAQLRLHHEEFISRLREMNPFFNKGIISSSPPNNYVIYPLDPAIAIMLVHEKRHYLQACRTLEMQNLPLDPQAKSVRP